MRVAFVLVVLCLVATVQTIAGKPQPRADFTLPNYVAKVEISAYKAGQPGAKAHHVYSGKTTGGNRSGVAPCNGAVSDDEGDRYTCSIRQANPNYEYVVKAWDEFGEPYFFAPTKTMLVCARAKSGWTCSAGP